MESIDDYMKYVQTYYEELLSNPRKLIAEMQELLTVGANMEQILQQDEAAKDQERSRINAR